MPVDILTHKSRASHGAVPKTACITNLPGENSGRALRPLLHFSPLVLVLAALGGLLLGEPACQHHSPAVSGAAWAEVDGQPILRDQVEKVYRSRVSSSGEMSDKEEALSYKLNILDELINNQILLAHAAHSGITVSAAEVDTKVAQLQSPYSKEEFDRRLRERGMDENDLRQEVRTSLTITKLIDRDIDARLKITDAEIAAYYQRNKASFDVPEMEYHLAQIEVTPRPDAQVRNLKNDDAKNLVMAQRKIQALYAQLTSGKDFATIAQEYSEDPTTASTGGDMGFIPASSLDANPGLKHVIMSLKEGQISGIVQTKDAFHIIKLIGIEHAGQQTLDDLKVQTAIRKTLTNEREQLLKAAYIESLRDQANVKNILAQQISDHGPESVQ